MKIALVSHDADLSGAPRVGFDIASALSRDHDVTVISKREGPLINLAKYAALVPNYVVTGTSHATGRIPFNEQVRRAVRTLDELKPDLVYANSTGACEWCVAARQLGVPAVLHTHEMEQGLRGLLAADVLKFDILKFVDLFVSASVEATRDFQRIIGGTPSRSFLFGIAIDTRHVREMAEKPVAPPRNITGRELASDRPVVAMCGNATARKGVHIFYDVAKSVPEADFLWIGPFYDDPVAHQVLGAYETEKTANVFITGEAANPYAYMARCDIFALTSVEDPNPLVIAEAIALGKRVVSFQKAGGSWRWTRKYGYALDGPTSADRLAAFLRRMLAAPGGADWVERQFPDFYEEVDIERRLPALRRELSALVGASV